jgi:hypothetical protein
MKYLLSALLLVLSVGAWADTKYSSITGNTVFGPYTSAYGSSVAVSIEGTYDGTMTIEVQPPDFVTDATSGLTSTPDPVVVYTASANETVYKEIVVGEGSYIVRLTGSSSVTAVIQSWEISNGGPRSP